MFLSKRSNGRYYIFYPQQNGKMTCISTKTKLKAEALKFLSNFTNELAKKANQKISPIKISNFFREFLRYSETIHSIKHTETLKATFAVVNRYFGEILLGELTLERLQSFMEERLKTVSVYSVKRDKANLSSTFSYGISRGLLITNVAKQIKLPKLPEKQPSFFTSLEYDLLMSKIESKDLRDLIQFAIQTGLRQMELLTLTWNQINIKDMYVILDNTGHVTKSKKVRTIPLSLKALQILTDREIKKAGELVFTLNSKPIKPDFLSHKFKSYVIEAKINPKLNFHSLRHTFASWLVQKGVSIFQVSKLMGHSSVNVTQIYSHLRNEDLRTAVNVLNN